MAYIDLEELKYNTELYDPNGPGPYYGLYDRPWPPAQR